MDEPIAKLTKLGLVLVSSECNSKITNILFSETSQHDYKNSCIPVCLEIEENRVKSNDYVNEKFRKQLERFSEGHYEAILIWKENPPHINDNKLRSKGRLTHLLRNLKRTKRLEVYDSNIQEQREKGNHRKSSTKTSQ